MWIKDSKDEKSITATVLMVTLITCLGKLFLSNFIIGSVSFGVFSGMDFAAIMTPTFAFYWGRRQVKIDIGKERKIDLLEGKENA